VKMREYHMIPATFVSIASGHTTTLMGRKLASLRLIDFLIKLLLSDEVISNHSVPFYLLFSYKPLFMINPFRLIPQTHALLLHGHDSDTVVCQIPHSSPKNHILQNPKAVSIC
jgi:hypothetical protein